jgi:hypothetical protein
MAVKHGQRTGSNARSGPSSPEERRTSKRVAYRLSPEAIATIDSLAARWGVSRSAAVARALAAALAAEDWEIKPNCNE